MARQSPLRCKDCERWYGAEDDEIGPCTIKNMRGEKRYMTFGMHECDEGMTATPGQTTTKELYEGRTRRGKMGKGGGGRRRRKA